MIKIGKKCVGQDFPPFVIAEMSGNHNQSLDKALELVQAAADSGAHALKLQTYTPDSMTLPIKSGEFYIDDPKSLWFGSSLYDLYGVASTPLEWHKPIMDLAIKNNLEVFSTPFDVEAVDFLESLGVPCFKIASFEATHIPLLKKVAETGKPVIVSTGMCTMSEISEMVDTLRKNGLKEIILLKCTSSYPAQPSSCNLNTIPHMRHTFQCEVGLSDHTLGLGVPLASIALGSTVIEKHFTIKRSDGGVDSAFSLEPGELQNLVFESERAWQSLGKVRYGPTESEEESIRYRRSIYVSKDICEGDPLTSDNIRIVRPGFGLSPKYFDIILGKKVNCDLKAGEAMKWSYFG